MNKKLVFHFRNQSTTTIDVKVQHSKAIIIEPHLLNLDADALLLLLEHQQINTQLDLTNSGPTLLLFFDDEQLFAGAAYAQGNQSAPFSLLTQYKQIVLLSYDASFPIHLLTKFTILS